jgi:hypothetical protein
VVVIAWVIHYYNIPCDQALIDSSVHVALAFFGVVILENAFGFYFPKGSFGWFRPVLVLLLTLGILALWECFVKISLWKSSPMSPVPRPIHVG